MINEGQKPPPFSLFDTYGKIRSLDEFAGQNVVIFFYPKDSTPGCTKEACGFRDLFSEFHKTNTVIIGISADSEQSHQKFISMNNLPFILLSDPDRKVMTSYGAYGKKMMYGKLIDGVIRSTVLIGKNGEVIKHWKRVPNVVNHPKKVLETIDSAC